MAKFSDEQVRALIEGPRRFRVIQFPGSDKLSVAVRCLTEAELDDCRTEAQIGIWEVCRRRGWDPAVVVQVDRDVLKQRIKRATLWKAFYDPDTIEKEPQRFFDAPEDVADLDDITVDLLWLAYLEHQDIANPVLELADDEKAQAAWDSIKKGSTPEAVLNAYGPDTLRRLLTILASEARNET